MIIIAVTKNAITTKNIIKKGSMYLPKHMEVNWQMVSSQHLSMHSELVAQLYPACFNSDVQ